MSGSLQQNNPPPLDYRVLFESVRGLCIVISPEDPVYRVVAVNDAYTVATNTTRGEILGRDLFEAFPESPRDAGDPLRASFRRVLERRSPDTIALRKDGTGEERYWRVVNTPVYAGDGAVPFIIHEVEAVTGIEHPQAIELERSYLQTILDTLTNPLLVLDPDLRVRTANQSFYGAFQLSEEETRGCGLQDLDDGQWNIPRLGDLLDEVLSRNSTFDDFEMKYALPHTGRRIFRLSGRPFYVEEKDKPLALLGIQDITFQKSAEDSLRASEERLGAVLRNLTEGTILTDPAGNVLSMNPMALQLYGFADGDETPRNLDGFMEVFIVDPQGRLLAPEEWPMRRALRGETFRGLELCICRMDTGLSWIGSHDGGPIRGDGGNIVLGVTSVRDMSTEYAAREEIRTANRLLHQLSADLLHVQDQERSRIARELHDGAVQLLAAVSMNLMLIGQFSGIAENAEAQRLVAETQSLAKQSSRELRTISYLLHPPDLDGSGLASALRSWVDGFSSRTGISTEVEVSDPGRLTPEVEIALFRIAQEALGNVQRHSGSAVARVRLFRAQGALHLEVEDAGRGFPPGVLEPDDQGTQRTGVGLPGMRERVRQLGGSLQIDSYGTGTTIRAVLPEPAPS